MQLCLPPSFTDMGESLFSRRNNQPYQVKRLTVFKASLKMLKFKEPNYF